MDTFRGGTRRSTALLVMLMSAMLQGLACRPQPVPAPPPAPPQPTVAAESSLRGLGTEATAPAERGPLPPPGQLQPAPVVPGGAPVVPGGQPVLPRAPQRSPAPAHDRAVSPRVEFAGAR